MESRQLTYAHRKHTRGICTQCGKNETRINKTTGYNMWLCFDCALKDSIRRKKKENLCR